MLGGSIGMQELVVILVIVLLIFGPGKLPEIGKGLGKAIKNFRQGASSLDESETDQKEDEKKLSNK